MSWSRTLSTYDRAGRTRTHISLLFTQGALRPGIGLDPIPGRTLCCWPLGAWCPLRTNHRMPDLIELVGVLGNALRDLGLQPRHGPGDPLHAGDGLAGCSFNQAAYAVSLRARDDVLVASVWLSVGSSVTSTISVGGGSTCEAARKRAIEQEVGELKGAS